MCALNIIHNLSILFIIYDLKYSTLFLKAVIMLCTLLNLDFINNNNTSMKNYPN